ncbi:hypothetical protein RND71_037998 [Anisodus tanguticus]|uniref:Uncharacterized protein n=1 Tax=Anisodus tanguticus TaxID=243964 RepID=A0AAE1R1V4_9SOLA|nr:hypothetical protein RND71_037998 [Anisodus tanguticus]
MTHTNYHQGSNSGYNGSNSSNNGSNHGYSGSSNGYSYEQRTTYGTMHQTSQERIYKTSVKFNSHTKSPTLLSQAKWDFRALDALAIGVYSKLDATNFKKMIIARCIWQITSAMRNALAYRLIFIKLHRNDHFRLNTHSLLMKGRVKHFKKQKNKIGLRAVFFSNCHQLSKIYLKSILMHCNPTDLRKLWKTYIM